MTNIATTVEMISMESMMIAAKIGLGTIILLGSAMTTIATDISLTSLIITEGTLPEMKTTIGEGILPKAFHMIPEIREEVKSSQLTGKNVKFMVAWDLKDDEILQM